MHSLLKSTTVKHSIKKANRCEDSNQTSTSNESPQSHTIKHSSQMFEKQDHYNDSLRGKTDVQTNQADEKPHKCGVCHKEYKTKKRAK